MDLAPDSSVGPYRIIRKLGAGGMGAVYLALHEAIARPVALKVLRADLATVPEFAQRFLNEARAVNIVRHPGVVSVSDFGQVDGGVTYIVMEYLEGESLTAYLDRKGGKLPPWDVMRLGRQAALALHAAHERRIVHRDLKPDNVMLVPDPAMAEGKRVKLLDFGIAKVAVEWQQDAVRTEAGQMLGTPTYMAPEQIRGAGNVDGKADVYAFGGILYRMLTGRPPFAGDRPLAVMSAHLKDPPPPLRTLDPAIPERIAALVHSMLVKEPQQRPAMSQVVGTLDDLLGHTAVSLPGRTAPAPSQMSLGTPSPAPRWRLRAGLATALSLIGLLVAWRVSRRHEPGVGLGPVAGHGPGITWQALSPGAARNETGVGPGTGRVCNAAGWCRENTGQVNRLRKIWGRTASNLWIVGDQGTILHFDGQAFTAARRTPPVKLHGIFGLPDGHVWAVGDQGTIMGLSPGDREWAQAATGTTTYLVAAWGSGDPRGDVWVVGKEGLILHYGGAAWVPVPSQTRKNLYAVWGSGPQDVWAAGKEGTLLRWDGAAWYAVPSGTTRQINALWGTGPADVWAVGKEGTVLHYDGAAWSDRAPPTKLGLNGICGAGPGQVWIVGDQGTVLHYQGSSFTTVNDSGVSDDLDGVWCTPGPERVLFAAGATGLLLRRELVPK